jgi:competence protein ComEC
MVARARSIAFVLLFMASACPSHVHPAAGLARPSGPPPAALSDPQGFRVHVIDVGQGSATLLEFPCAAVLVDTGGEDDVEFHSTPALMAYLDHFFASRPDLHGTLAALYLSHPHIDHVRGARSVLEKYRVLNLITDGLTLSSGGEQQQWMQEQADARGIPRFEVQAAAIPAGGLTNAIIDPVKCETVDPRIEVLWGAVDKQVGASWDPDALEDMNNHSVVIRVDVGDASLLLLGDVETPAIAGLLERQAASGALDVDIMQVAHHGSHHSTTVPLLQAISPRLAFIGVGTATREHDYTAWNWGHPRRVAIRDLVATVSGVRPPRTVPVALGMHRFTPQYLRRAVYATGWDGDIVIELHGEARPKVWTTR